MRRAVGLAARPLNKAVNYKDVSMYELLVAVFAIVVGGETTGQAVLAAVASEHVGRLGHPAYRVREAAGSELFRLGAAAVGPLRAGIAGPDAERARRCRQVLGRIEEADREAKVARLVTEPTSNPPADLPQVTEFLRVAGDSLEARRLYASLYQERGLAFRLLQAEPASTAMLEHACADLRRLRDHTSRDLTAGEFAWVCFLASRAAPEAVRGVIEDGLMWTWWSGDATKLLHQAEPGSPLRRLFLASLERHRNHSLFGWGGTRLVAEVRMREAVPVLIRIATDADTKPGSRAHALALLPALGGRQAARELRAHRALFEDQTEISVCTFASDHGQPLVRIQARDVALGVCAELEGRDLDELGFLSVPRKIYESEPYRYAFLDDASRAAAFDRWKGLPPPGPK